MNSNRDERNPAPWPPPATTVLIACAFTFLHPTAHAQGAGYWHTRANEIVDAGGKPVRIAGINWYGFETRDQIVHGLWAKDYHDVLKTIKEQGYNTVRLPFSNEMVETPIIPTNFRTESKGGSINADLEGLNSLQIMDRIIAAAGADGLKVILDDHPGSEAWRRASREERPLVHGAISREQLDRRLADPGCTLSQRQRSAGQSDCHRDGPAQ